MYDSWVAYCRTQKRRNLYRFHGRAQKTWDQIDEYDSQGTVLCQLKKSEKTKGPSLEKNQVKLPHHRSPYALKFEDRSREETARRSDASAEMRGDLAKEYQ